MKLIPTKEKFDLSNESIDTISQRYQSILSDLKYEKRNIIAIRLNIENYLLGYQEKLGQDAAVVLSIASKIGKPSITLSIAGEEYNPLAQDADELGEWNNTILQNMSVQPSLTYFNNTNYIQLKLNKPTMNPILKLILSIAVGSGVGGIGFLMPDYIRLAVQDSILTPIHNSFLGILSVVGLLLVLLSVVSGIIEAGDISTFSRIGKRLVGALMGINAFILLITAICTFGIFDLNFVNRAGGKSQFAEIFKIVLDILPNNLVTPFYKGNALQIMVIGMAIGIAILALGDTTKQLGKFFNQLFSVSLFIMEFIEKLLPAFISIVIVQIMWSSELKEIVGMWKLIVFGVVACILIVLLAVVATSAYNKISPFKLFKKMLPTFLLALSTASSSAVHGTCVECCQKEFGIEPKLTTFGVSFATGIYKPATAVLYFITSLYLAEMYSIDVSVMWLVVAFVICLIMSVATPPVAGGAAVAYTIIFNQLGVPTKILAVVLALDIVFDFVATATDKVLICTSLLNLARRNGLLNSKKLYK